MVDWNILTAPTTADEVEWRVQRSGVSKDGRPWAVIVPYPDARAVVARLNRACEPGGWTNTIRPLEGKVEMQWKVSADATINPSAGEWIYAEPGQYDDKDKRHIIALTNGIVGFVQEISILTENGWVSRSDGAQTTDIEPIKGGISGALKRAAVAWGMFVDLYEMQDVMAEFAQAKPPYGDKTWNYIRIQRTEYWWKPPGGLFAKHLPPKKAEQDEEDLATTLENMIQAGKTKKELAECYNAAPKVQRDLVKNFPAYLVRAALE